jgi:oligosaccharide repeat unit polymerase
MIISAVVFSVKSITFFHLGALVFNLIKYSNLKDFKETVVNEEFYCRKTGKILGLIAIVPTLYVDIRMMTIALNDGYKAIYTNSFFVGPLDDLALLIKPAILFLICGYKNKRKMSNFIFVAAILYSLLKIFIIGGRGLEMIFIISLFWLRHNVIYPINFKKLLKYSVLGYILILISNMVFYVRRLDSKSFNYIAEKFIDITINNSIFMAMGEFGGTLRTVILSIINVPTRFYYMYGMTYAYSLLKILPNIGGIIDRANYMSSPSIILSQHYPGIGGSIIAEYYFNFGLYGIFIAFFFGGIIGRISYKKDNNKNLALGIYVLYAMFLYLILWTVRDSFSYLVRTSLSTIIVPLVIYKTVIRKYRIIL